MAQTLSELLVRLGVDAGSYYAELDKAQRRNQSWATSWKAIGRDIGKAAAGYSLAFGALVKSQINALDELDESAQKTGVSVEALSRLNYAAGLEGVEDFTSSLVKLNRSLSESQNPASEQAKALEALGVSAADASGKVRSTDAVLIDIAEAFSQSEDGAAKSAIAMALFGKTGADLIPFLNNGRDGLQKLTGEADRFGVTASSKAAAAAGELNDNIYRLGAVVRGAANDVAEGLAPTLAQLTTQLADNTTKSEGFALAVRQIDSGLKLVISSGVILNGVFQAVGKLIGGTAAALGALTTDMKWYHLAPPLFIAKAFQNADMAASAFGASMEDAQGSTTDMFMSLDTLWTKVEAHTKKAEEKTNKAATNILKYGGDKQRAAAAKQLGEAQRDQEKALSDSIAREEKYRQLVAASQSEDLRARSEYVQRRVEIEQVTDADTEQRRELMLQAEQEYNGKLAKIREDRDQAEQDQRLKKKQEEELDLQNQDRALQNDPLANLAGIKSVEDLARAMDPLKNVMFEFSDVANDAFTTAGRGAADLATNLLLTGDAGEDSAKRIGQALLRDVVNGIIQVGIQMVAQKALATVLRTADTTEVVAQQGAIAAAAAPAAAAVSLSSFGTNSLGAIAAIGATFAAAMAMFGGGRELGGGVYPGMAYNTNEQDRPEAYRRRSDGRIFLMPGSSGGDVMRMDDAQGGRGSGRGLTVNITNAPPGSIPDVSLRNDVLTVDMVPGLLNAASSRARSDLAQGIRTGRDPVASAISGKWQVQQRPNR